MPKTCQSVTNCIYNVFSHNYCQLHQLERTDDKWLKSSKGKITPKVRESVLKPTTSKRIKPISDKKLEELKEYRIVRDRYFKNNPVCEFPNCSSREITLHHAKGRIGSLLTDDRYFKSLCIYHHTYCEEHPTEAKRLGLSFDRLSV